MYKPMTKSILFSALLALICFSTSVSANVSNNELPVKFIRFYAQQVGDYAHLRWVTQSEFDNDFFTVEWSKDMIIWESLETVAGSGSSPGEGEYAYFDTEPKSGMNYYRIRQTDLDGSFDFSHIEKVNVTFFADEVAEAGISPNPMPGYSTSFVVNSPTTLIGTTVKLMDIAGKGIQINVDVNDTEMTVTPFNKIPGLYFLIIQKEEKAIVKKIKIE